MAILKHWKVALSLIVLLVAISVTVFRNDEYSLKMRKALSRTRDILTFKTLKLVLYNLDSKVLPTQRVEWSFPIKKAVASDKRPNIIFIVADDLGYNDLYGSRLPATENIRKIGEDGVRFSKAYSGHATCAPSRASMISGRFPTRFGYEFTPVHYVMSKIIGRSKYFDIDSTQNTSYLADPIFHAPTRKIPPVEEMAVPTDVPVVSEILRDAGYDTILIGKWHLGASTGTRPWERGYEQSLYFIQAASQYFSSGNKSGIPAYLNDFIDDMMWDFIPYQIAKDSGPEFRPDEYITDYLSKQAVEAIKATRRPRGDVTETTYTRIPFFLHLCYNAPHTPLHALDSDYFDPSLDHITNHRERVYVAMIKAVDRGVVQIMSTVRDLGEEDNTLVVFTSDNGGANYIKLLEMNTPFRGGKGTLFEGGLRVPFLMKWPNQIAANTVHEQTVGHVDLFSTFVSAAGVSKDILNRIPVDGVDLLTALRESNPPLYTSAIESSHSAVGVRPPIFWRSGHYRCLIYGDWKLSVAARPHKAWLYNLARDPTEVHNLAPAYVEPGKAKFTSEACKSSLSSMNNSASITYPSPESLLDQYNASSTDLYDLLYSILTHLSAQQSEPLWPALSETPVVVDLEALVRDNFQILSEPVLTQETFAKLPPNVHSYSSLYEVLIRAERPEYSRPQFDANTEIILWPN